MWGHVGPWGRDYAAAQYGAGHDATGAGNDDAAQVIWAVEEEGDGLWRARHGRHGFCGAGGCKTTVRWPTNSADLQGKRRTRSLPHFCRVQRACRLTAAQLCLLFFCCYQNQVYAEARVRRTTNIHQYFEQLLLYSPSKINVRAVSRPGHTQSRRPLRHQTLILESLPSPKIIYTHSHFHLFLSRSRTCIALTPSHTSPTGSLSNSSRCRRDRTSRGPGRGGKGGGGGRSSRGRGR